MRGGEWPQQDDRVNEEGCFVGEGLRYRVTCFGPFPRRLTQSWIASRQMHLLHCGLSSESSRSVLRPRLRATRPGRQAAQAALIIEVQQAGIVLTSWWRAVSRPRHAGPQSAVTLRRLDSVGDLAAKSLQLS
jgi:hypothetical protein